MAGDVAAMAGERWNRPLSWELIFRITPHLPGPVLELTHHATTLLFFTLMRKERNAARRNLARIAGREGKASLRDAYRLFLEFSRYMVTYATLAATGLEGIRSRIDGLEDVKDATLAALARGKGVIIATAHVGQWDLALKLLSGADVPVHAVMRQREAEEVRRYAAAVRSSSNLRVHQVGEGGEADLVGLELVLALRRGEIVALQVDRPLGRGDRAVPFFGAPAPLPAGPVHLAWASGAPVLPVFMVREPGDRHRVVALPPLELKPPTSREDREVALDASLAQLASTLEQVIGAHPEQWFAFTDAWPLEAKR